MDFLCRRPFILRLGLFLERKQRLVAFSPWPLLPLLRVDIFGIFVYTWLQDLSCLGVTYLIQIEKLSEITYADRYHPLLVNIAHGLLLPVGQFLQVACQIQGYICEKELKALLNNAIKKSFEHYKDYPTWPED